MEDLVCDDDDEDDEDDVFKKITISNSDRNLKRNLSKDILKFKLSAEIRREGMQTVLIVAGKDSCIKKYVSKIEKKLKSQVILQEPSQDEINAFSIKDSLESVAKILKSTDPRSDSTGISSGDEAKSFCDLKDLSSSKSLPDVLKSAIGLSDNQTVRSQGAFKSLTGLSSSISLQNIIPAAVNYFTQGIDSRGMRIIVRFVNKKLEGKIVFRPLNAIGWEWLEDLLRVSVEEVRLKGIRVENPDDLKEDDEIVVKTSN